ncbi:MAG: D-alanyl-D-alanine carboxypeptidase [Cyclobacteriaceae bacterium]
MKKIQGKALFKKSWLLLSLACFWLSSCQSLRYNFTNRDISKEINNSPIFSGQFTGFTLFDPEDNNYLCNYNDHLPFTPASNIKILTTLACLENLGDSIATFKFSRKGDSVFISPLADPTFLHPDFPDQPASNFLRNKNVFLNYPEPNLKRFGPGWAWDDYEYDYQPEKSYFPIYGNVVRVFNQNDSLKIVPDFFMDYTQLYVGERPGNLIYRSESANIFNAWIESDTSTYEREIPFINSDELLIELLKDTLGTNVTVVNKPFDSDSLLLSQSKTYALAMMMLPSDNFMAEHLLMHCALMNGFTSVNAYRRELMTKWSAFLPDHMRWVDGSGLSRYNLVSPRNMVGMLNQIYQNQEWNTIADIFPAGGASGTLKNWYKSEEPYLYAKTGTLSNNHSLSGFLITDSGKKLIFSLMNNHYLSPTLDVKNEMEALLLKIKEAY